jgi:hypothetical protein
MTSSVRACEMPGGSSAPYMQRLVTIGDPAYLRAKRAGTSTASTLDCASPLSLSLSLNATGPCTDAQFLPDDEESNKIPPEDIDTCSNDDLTRHLVSYVLNIKEKHLLPDEIQRPLISKARLLVEVVSQNLKGRFKTALEQNGVSTEGFADVLSFDLLPFDFSCIESKYKLNSYVHANFPFVKPVE